jgi:hypothetical protein
MITRISTNEMEIHVGGLILFISYKTPVAWYDTESNIMYVTKKKWSKTTTKHLSKFVDRCPIDDEHYLLDNVEQEELDLLYKNILNGDSVSSFFYKHTKKDRFEDLII